jgi:hypothetical protein
LTERTWKSKTAGILTIIAGCLGIGFWLLITIDAIAMGSAAAAGFLDVMDILGRNLLALGGLLYVIWADIIWASTVVVGIEIVAIIGGIYALRRRVWGFALAGAILATMANIPLGILSIMFVSMGKKEFVRAPK